MQRNDLISEYRNHNYFKSAVGFFSFFSSTNAETKNVCPIAYNNLLPKQKRTYTMRITLNFTCKYTFDFDEDFVFLEKYNFLVNLKTGKILKQVMKGGSIGYVLKGKFYTLTYLKEHLTKIKKQETPF